MPRSLVVATTKKAADLQGNSSLQSLTRNWSAGRRSSPQSYLKYLRCRDFTNTTDFTTLYLSIQHSRRDHREAQPFIFLLMSLQPFHITVYLASSLGYSYQSIYIHPTCEAPDSCIKQQYGVFGVGARAFHIRLTLPSYSDLRHLGIVVPAPKEYGLKTEDMSIGITYCWISWGHHVNSHQLGTRMLLQPHGMQHTGLSFHVILSPMPISQFHHLVQSARS